MINIRNKAFGKRVSSAVYGGHHKTALKEKNMNAIVEKKTDGVSTDIENIVRPDEEQRMKVIKSKREIHDFYYGVDKYSVEDGEWLGKLNNIFIKYRQDEASEIYLIFCLYDKGWPFLKSQMFYVSSSDESRFGKFFENIRAGFNVGGFAYAKLIGTHGIVEIRNEIKFGINYANIEKFSPISKEEYKRIEKEEREQ